MEYYIRKPHSSTKSHVPHTILVRVRCRVSVQGSGLGLGLWNLVGGTGDIVGEYLARNTKY